MSKIYVSDMVGEEFKQWGDNEKIIIATPTGSGKTTFVIEKLVDYAYSRRKHVVYFCNRKVLNDQFMMQSKEQLLKLFNFDEELKNKAEKYLHIFTYQYSEKSENYPNVVIYGETEYDDTVLSPKDIMYYIFDEAHYFANDAIFNSGTNFWCADEFKYGTSVFLTATPKPLLALLAFLSIAGDEKNECIYAKFIEYYKELYSWNRIIKVFCEYFEGLCSINNITPMMPSGNDLIQAIRQKIEYPLDPWFRMLEKAFLLKKNNIRYYNSKADFSHLDVWYFSKYSELEELMMMPNDEKWIVFVDDEKEGIILETRLNSSGKTIATFISAKNIKRSKSAKKVYREIVETEMFTPKVLIATAVLDCGINIRDDNCLKKVRHIVIASDNEATFLQMLGRKRITEGANEIDNKGLKLYVKALYYKNIISRYRKCMDSFRYLLEFSICREYVMLKYLGYDDEGDQSIYGSPLAAERYSAILCNLSRLKNMALIYPKQNTIYADAHGYVTGKKIDGIDYQSFLKEYDYSKTALVNMLLNIYDYRRVLSDYKTQKNEYFVKLVELAITYKELFEEQKLNNPYEEMDPYYILEFALVVTGNQGLGYLFSLQGQKSEKQPQQEIDFRSITETDSMFYLKHQLSWIEKEYDVKQWCSLKILRDYLESFAQSEVSMKHDRGVDESEPGAIIINEQKEFSMRCTQLILALPNAPKRIKADASRYRNDPEKYPGKDKLNSCFRELDLPYMIVSSQKKYDGVDKKKTCWKIVKIQPDAENNEVVNNKKSI